MFTDNLTPEQQEKAKACKSVEEVLALAQDEGYELTDSELDAVSGGDWDCWDICSEYVNNNDCPGFMWQ